jgi:predicted Zn-dependent peptidase
VRPEESRPGGEAQVLAAFVAPPAGDEDEYAMRLVEELATGPNGALDAELRERQHAVEAVALEYRPRLRGGSVLVRTRVRPGDEERAVPALEAALRKLGSGDLLYRDYRTAVNRAVARYWIEQQSHAAQVAAMMAFALQGSGVDEITSYPARLQAVRPEDVGPLAARILVVDRAVISRVHAR